MKEKHDALPVVHKIIFHQKLLRIKKKRNAKARTNVSKIMAKKKKSKKDK